MNILATQFMPSLCQCSCSVISITSALMSSVCRFALRSNLGISQYISIVNMIQLVILHQAPFLKVTKNLKNLGHSHECKNILKTENNYLLRGRRSVQLCKLLLNNFRSLKDSNKVSYIGLQCEISLLSTLWGPLSLIWRGWVTI